MKMQRRQFRIGELAKQLKVEKYVVRFWEKEFDFKSTRSAGKQRFYSEKDLETFMQIKELLYDKGFTISGAKKQLIDAHTPILPADTALIRPSSTLEIHNNSSFVEQLINIRKQLIKLKELL
jgi:DNA-binding transcriptional MerR regulator